MQCKTPHPELTDAYEKIARIVSKPLENPFCVKSDNNSYCGSQFVIRQLALKTLPKDTTKAVICDR